jgi:hypothetical protein
METKIKTATWKGGNCISFFNGPITCKQPAGVVSAFGVYQFVKSPAAKPETTELRNIAKDVNNVPAGMDVAKWVKDRQRAYKGQHLKYVTPSGEFAYCNDASMLRHSGLLCVDLDDICPVSEVNPVFYDFLPECYNMATNETDAVEQLKQRLISDPLFDTVMAFRSPRANGLKWWIAIDLEKCDHRTWFTGVRNYLLAAYKLSDDQVDKHCGNLSRACYLCHDPLVYLRTDLIENFCI